MDESRRVRETYDRIASHFADTREHPWPEVEAFLEGRQGTLGLDVGCANGRHAQLLAARTDRVLGVDASRGLLFEARTRARDRGFGVDLLQGDAAALPVRSERVDLAVYVATIHHLPDRETRVGSLDELARVLAPGGRALVSAWSTAHGKFDAEAGFDTTVDWTLPGGETVPRFYHIYAPEEFRAEVEDSALAVESFEVSSGNCYATVKREQ
ncbi:class I SAM-dependent methyltransferase [Halalkalicoccus jeotgali]|uniref:Methyltransferase type 11 n=1 Tax=Halalkalicoccus jeotgali (strain DSM 18796 / CECT 7217 / JCM 14584 / KCTC 4019 / B3) TaxID=795797 RepID=D8J4X4_HALJB|nr:class I SAM-dependent methyltransferase [Halalkalicoccus jeotgali]ADJ15591.1 Methyltransferase type 11 [Halalkalicoccus jeotgali B3]ELY36331.1 type 11 methyltransferase [Halalkalicoccus jeotgali B3]